MQHIFLVISILISQLVSIYTISVSDVNGNTLNLSTFAGKKILLVNTSSNSPHVAQYAKLEQLYQLHRDSLVIIAFPSNSFGNEPGNDSTIKSFVLNTYHINFYLASKSSVIGADKSALYNWLAEKDLNGMMRGLPRGDFHKFLIDGEGKLIGRFTELVDPLDSELQNAIIN